MDRIYFFIFIFNSPFFVCSLLKAAVFDLIFILFEFAQSAPAMQEVRISNL
jgi:hypothetical protein